VKSPEPAHTAIAPLEQREFEFTEKDFAAIRALIHEDAGIALNESKREMVYSRLSRRLRTLGLRRFSDYIARVTGEDDEERQVFINALTTNLTAFFREPHHFTMLADYLRYKRIEPPLTLWCAAASTGEEPYSIAMTLAELFGFEADVRIIASDIDTEALAAAQQGVYAMERLQSLPSFSVKRFFLRGTGKNAGFARVRPELRAMVHFQQLNLLEDSWDVAPGLFAIFCRNVMIYFDKPTQYKILQRFAPLLRPDGLLFVGHSESLFHAADLFRMRERTVYELVHARSSAYVGGPPPPEPRSEPRSA
jgi:chemotaxis protein methyltransferase CheR